MPFKKAFNEVDGDIARIGKGIAIDYHINKGDWEVIY